MSWKIHDNLNDKIEVKRTYAETLEDFLKNGENVIVADADLAGSSGTTKLFEKYPNNCVDFGICEQNMISAAAAMSRVGYKAFVHSFAPFVSRRIMDQLYVSAAFTKQSIHIYASEPGYWSQYNGATHTTFEDIAIMKSIPNVTVVAPSDAVSFKWVMDCYEKNGGVVYNRCTRRLISQIYETGSTFEYGKSNLLLKGNDVLIIAEGPLVAEALEAAEQLKKQDFSVSVIDLLFIKPLDKELIVEEAKKHKLVITLENHNIIGGIGESIGAQLALNNIKCDFKMLGVNDRFGEVGTVEYLKEKYSISVDDIVRTVKDYVNL